MLSSQEVAQKVLETANTFTVGTPALMEMHDANNRDVIGLDDEDFAVFAHMSTDYKGTPPEDPRVLNSLIMDLVKAKKQVLEAVLLAPLYSFLRTEYGDGDLSDFDKGDVKDFIWESQIDYFVMVDEENGRVHFDIELVLDMETSEEPEEDSEDWSTSQR